MEERGHRDGGHAFSVLSGAAEALHVKVDTEKIRKIADRYERDRYEVPSATVAISDLLQSAIQSVIDSWQSNPKPDRLIVLIDDLDRCDADMAQKLLEGLKVFSPPEQLRIRDSDGRGDRRRLHREEI